MQSLWHMCAALLQLPSPFHSGLPADTFQMLVVALVHSRLDYGNSMLVSLPVYLTCRLQSLALWPEMLPSVCTGCRSPKIIVHDRCTALQGSPWLCTMVFGTSLPCCWCVRQTLIRCYQSTCTVFKPSTISSHAFPVAAAYDLECTAWQCRLSIIHRLIPAPAENFSFQWSFSW